MKNQFLLLLLLLGMLSCKKSDKAEEINKETTFLNDKWDRIRIPDGGQVQAVAGSIDDTLVVSTLYNTYLVTKKGTAFTLTSRHLNNTPGLYVIKDTIYALSGSSYDAKFENHYAGLPSYYTVNKGVTWHPASHKASLYIQTGVVVSETNVMIKLNYHVGADKNGKGSNFVLKTSITTKQENGETFLLDHPVVDEQPINLHLDEKDRLYILTGGSFNEAGVYLSPSISSPAYIYITKDSI